MASSSTYAFFHCHHAFQKFPFFCVTLCVLHALQNATESHSAEYAPAKMGHGPHSSKLVIICVVLLLFVLFYVLFVCKCLLYYCHGVLTQLQLTNISYHTYLCDTGICHSVWMTSDLQTRRHPYRVTNTSVA